MHDREFGVAAGVLWRQRHTPSANVIDSGSPAIGSLHYKLALLDINLAPLFIHISVALLALCAFLLVNASFPQQVAVAFITAGSVWSGSYFLLNDLVCWRIKQLEHQLIDAMDTINSAMQSGLTITQAISTATTLTKGSLQREFKEITKRLQLGYDDMTAMNRFSICASNAGSAAHHDLGSVC